MELTQTVTTFMLSYVAMAIAVYCRNLLKQTETYILLIEFVILFITHSHPLNNHAVYILHVEVDILCCHLVPSCETTAVTVTLSTDCTVFIMMAVPATQTSTVSVCI